MPTDVPDHASELLAIERARDGDHDAFVQLYRQDAPPAWRLALALTADADLAADAVAQAFARVLAPARPGVPRSDVPFRLRLLSATRHVVLDRGTGAAHPGVDPDGGADPERARSTRAAEVMQAFHQLPERWRTVLWLATVEGIELDRAARVLGVVPEGAADLAERAEAGLRTQWQRDRIAAGEEPGAAPEGMARLLQSVLPLPRDLFDEVEARWRAQRERKVGPVGLVLPGGRPVPRWAERGLLVGTAAVIAAGITSALVVDRDPDVRRARGGQLAAEATTPTTAGSSTTTPTEPTGYLDGDGEGPASTSGPAGDIAPMFAAARAAAVARSTGDRVSGAAGGDATPARPGPSSPSEPAPSTPTTEAEPELEATVGIGPALAVSLGDQCTGLSLGGRVVGCKPDPDTGVNLEG